MFRGKLFPRQFKKKWQKTCFQNGQELEDEKKKLLSKDNTIADISKQLSELQISYNKNISTALQERTDELTNQHKLHLDEIRKNTASLFEHDIKYKDNKINELEKHINNLKTTIELEIKDKLDKTYAEERIKSALQTAHLESQNKDKDVYIKKIESQYQQHINSLTKNIDSYKSSIDNIKSFDDYQKITTSALERITNVLQPIVKYYGGTNTEKGNAGENKVLTVLMENKKYVDALVEDTSGLKARGDIYFKWRQLKCLIEIKNKKDLTKEDMHKFERDIEESINSERSINCAIFISLASSNYPERGRDILQIDYIHNIPTIYIYMSNDNDMHYAIICLEKLVSTHTTTNEQTNKLTKHFIDYYNRIKNLITFFNIQMKSSQHQYKIYTKQYNDYNDLLATLDVDYNEINPVLVEDVESEEESGSEEESNPDSDSDSDSKSKSNDALTKDTIEKEIIKRLLKGKSITISDLCKSFDISIHQFNKLCSYKTLMEEIKLNAIKSIITSDIVEKINTYYKKYNKYPPRPYVTKHIIPDLKLRKLAKLTSQKKVLESIFQYCSTFTSPWKSIYSFYIHFYFNFFCFWN